MPETTTKLLIGAVAGAGAGLIVWALASGALDRQFRAGSSRLSEEMGAGTIEMQRRLVAGRQEMEQALREAVAREVPAAVHAEVDQTLRSYGITPETTAALRVVLSQARSWGLI